MPQPSRFLRLVKVLVLPLLLLVSLQKCLSPEGFQKDTWKKAALVGWYNQYRPTNERLARFGYRGSDDRFHYFITRPMDSFLMPRILRTELQMPDERPLGTGSSAPMYHYLVDPPRDFIKIPEP